MVWTLWGELAWQLGGKKAFARVRADDEKATSPGDVLRELFMEYGPCLILIDEWVAYARQLHEQSDLPGESFAPQSLHCFTITNGVLLEAFWHLAWYLESRTRLLRRVNYSALGVEELGSVSAF